MSMKKLSEQTFKILSIKECKKYITLLLDCGEFTITKSFFTDNYFYPSKEITQNELRAIKNNAGLSNAETYLSKLLSKKRYTKAEVTSKLLSHFSLSSSEITALLRPYLTSGLISDNEYVQDFVETKTKQGYGLKYIEDKLKEKGVDLSHITCDQLHEYSLIAQNKVRLLLAKKDLPKEAIKTRKNHLYAFLLRRGFTKEQADDLMNSYFSSFSKEQIEQEEQTRRKHLELLIDKYHSELKKKETDGYKLKNKLIQKCINRGYSYQEVYDIIAKKGYFYHD